jgi:hypothetical protein
MLAYYLFLSPLTVLVFAFLISVFQGPTQLESVDND